MMARATSRISSSVILDGLELDVLELEPSSFFWTFWSPPVFWMLKLDWTLDPELELEAPVFWNWTSGLDSFSLDFLELDVLSSSFSWTGWTPRSWTSVLWTSSSDFWTDCTFWMSSFSLELELELEPELDPPLDWTLKLDSLDFLDPPASSFTDVLELDVVFWTGWTLELDSLKVSLELDPSSFFWTV
jgi:hypothetical protein